MIRRKITFFLLLFISAIIIRLYKIEELPPGMYGDEVSVANESLKLVDSGQITPFIGYYSHPTPLLYLTAASIKVFGHNITAIRLPSVVFGSLDAALFFIFLSLFLSETSAFLIGLILVFCYPLLVLSRLAYEPPAALFFQILSAIFIVKKKPIYLGIALAGGLYTYLSFRIFAVVALFFAGKPKDILKTFLAMIIAASPLLIYSFFDWHGFWLRSTEISIFGRGYIPGEFFKELWGSIYRTGGFFFIGDPNPGKNPANIPMFDLLTIILVVLGIFKNKKAAIFSLLFFIPAFLSDILSTEVIPEFHYYGLGHPNTLRVSGLILFMAFLAGFGLEKLKKFPVWLAGGVVIIICWINFSNYFDQKNTFFNWYVYNWRVNQASILMAIEKANESPVKEINISQNIDLTLKPKIFLNSDKKITVTKNYEILPGINIFDINEKNIEQIKILATSSAYVVNDPTRRSEVLIKFFLPNQLPD